MERPSSYEVETPGQTDLKYLRNVKRRVLDDSGRAFIAWDGEGVNLRGPGRPQSYVLFGNSVDTPIVGLKGLGLWDCLDHIIEAGRRHPGSVHIGYAFGYDSNMIVQNLPPTLLGRLHKQGWVKLKRGHTQYIVTYRPHKYFQVSHWVPGRAANTKVTVRIYDIFTFFMTSFVQAYEDMVGPVQEILSAGKDARKDFSIDQIDMIRTYWELEIQNLRELAEKLREHVYSAGLPITEWHGPGALSSLAMKQHGVKAHMKRSNDDVRLASRYAYAAGRFELYKVGRVVGPIYGIDRNSAYPYALTKLPSLAAGEWSYRDSTQWTGGGTLRAFGLYHLRLSRGGLTELSPSPLYLRDKHHELYYPWHVEGWYWGPEAMQAVRKGAKVLESWEFNDTGIRPFAFISPMYSQRQKWKSAENSAQMALKLCMNSMYGKLAQRVGYDPKSGRVPAWHQLEWAGWTTSLTRAAMYSLMEKIRFSDLIAVETDGIYTTMPPSELGITPSTDLGGWSIDVYDEMVYVQSGLAWLRKGECKMGCPHDRDAIRDKRCAWTQKRRGLDWDSFTLDQCLDYVRRLEPNGVWPDYTGYTTRFATMGQALASKNVSSRHCVWTHAERTISTGRAGKRIHIPAVCQACKSGNTAYDMAHDLAISPRFISNGIRSYPHHIPWEEFNAGDRWWDNTYADTLGITP
jgi:hypothetical protein